MFTLLHPFLKISPREVEFSRRNFSCSRADIRERLENVGRAFLHGYHAALEEIDLETLATKLDQIGTEHQGFAYEGAAMALALLDGITPWKKANRFQQFLAGPGEPHIYMVCIGAGWAYARLPWLRRRIESAMAGFDPLLCWLVIDGYGFHEGYFHWHTGFHRRVVRLSLDAQHVFYQGLGRSLWFICGADPAQLRHTVSGFAPQFQNDAWSGIGLACAYAGGLDRSELDELLAYAGPHAPAVAQGAAFAAKARQVAGNPAHHTEQACRAFCGMSAEEAAMLCDQTRQAIDAGHHCPWQHWRELLQTEFAPFTQPTCHPESPKETHESNPARNVVECRV